MRFYLASSVPPDLAQAVSRWKAPILDGVGRGADAFACVADLVGGAVHLSFRDPENSEVASVEAPVDAAPELVEAKVGEVWRDLDVPRGGGQAKEFSPRPRLSNLTIELE